MKGNTFIPLLLNCLYIFGFFVLFLSLIILALLHGLQKIKLQSSKKQNALLEERLEKRNQEITTKNIEILHANEVLKETQEELKNLVDTPELKHKLIPILNNLKNNRKDFNWEEFDKMFADTNSKFYKELLSRSPYLSSGDLRLSALLKLNLSTKEISAITGQSINSINIARHRLRKKLKIDKNQSISGFLHQL